MMIKVSRFYKRIKSTQCENENISLNHFIKTWILSIFPSKIVF